MLRRLLFLFTLLYAIVEQRHIVVAENHVAMVRCLERLECAQHIDYEIIDMIHVNLRNESDPCENFWDYACGEWTAAPYYDHVDNFGAITNYYAQQLKEYLTTNNKYIIPSADMNAIGNLLLQLRRYYNACLKTNSYYLSMERYFDEMPLMSSVQWPNMREVLAQMAWHMDIGDFNWLSALAELRRYGVNGIFFDQSVGVAFNDSTKYVVELKMPDEAENFRNKHEFVKYFIEFNWIDNPTVEHMQFAAEIYELEVQLKKLHAKHRGGHQFEEYAAGQQEEDDSEVEVALTLQQLKQRVPNIDWQHYFAIIFQGIASDRELVYNKDQLPLEVSGLNYMRDVADLLSHTDNRTICYYIIMHLCKYLLAVSPQITDKNCINHMGVVMPLGLNFIYDRYIYDQTREHDEQVLRHIFDSLKKQFTKYLQDNQLHLNADERNYLQTKLDKMQLRVGNLPQRATINYYNHYYDTANISETNFFHNHWEMLRFRTEQQYKELLIEQYIDMDTYYIYDDITQIRNAPYFVHQRNLLVVPMVFLSLPFYHYSQHEMLQYSLVGWIIAHELNHAFETDGITMDGNGNESPIGIAIKAKPKFIESVHCLRHTPTNSIIERLADVNGFQLAFDAYFNGKENGANSLSAGEFNTHQLYFLNFAQFFCGSLPRPIDHDRDDVRVNEIAANMPEFKTAFQCEQSIGVNSMKPCQMWRA